MDIEVNGTNANPVNNSCERGLRAELRAYLLGREVNGGRRPVEPQRRVKLTGEQASWLNTVCDHSWPEYQALLDREHGAAIYRDLCLYAHPSADARARLPDDGHERAYRARELQELLNRLDEDRDARDAAEFDRELASEHPVPAAYRTPLGRTIVRDLVGAAGQYVEPTDVVGPTHRYGDLVE